MKLVHVAVAVIESKNGDICLARRADHQHQGGLWEFPGGKVEADESFSDALKREIFEELGVTVLQHYPLIKIRYQYPDKEVLLDVHCVNDFAGEAHGKEGQPVIWCPRNQLHEYEFPAANKGIVNALTFPDKVAIVNESDASAQNTIVNRIMDRYTCDEIMFYFRRRDSEQVGLTSSLGEKGYKVFAKDADQYRHLTSECLMSLDETPKALLLSASCHSMEEVNKANALGVDFIFISPVNATPSHPEVKGIGWDEFQRLAELAHMPVYALGGVALEDISKAKTHGAQGIAAIRAFL